MIQAEWNIFSENLLSPEPIVRNRHLYIFKYASRVWSASVRQTVACKRETKSNCKRTQSELYEVGKLNIAAIQYARPLRCLSMGTPTRHIV